jgi:membrane-associated PAP2 superfamily phosphatase
MSADSVPSSKTNIFFKANSIHSSIVAILELIRGAQCLIEVIRYSGEEEM